MKTLVQERKWCTTKKISLFTVLLLSLILTSCGSVIRSSTVQLSADVGNRITEMEALHQLALQRYFDMEKAKVEDFLTQTWEPLFLKNFLGTSQVLQMLQNVSRIDETNRNQLQAAFADYLTDPSEAKKATDDLVGKLNESRKAEDGVIRTIVTDYVEDDKIDAAVIHITSLLGTDDPARIIFDFTQAAHVEMNAKREALLAPIEHAKAEAAAELSGAYAQLIRGQSTITGRLEAAAKVSNEQDKLLGALGFNRATKTLQTKLSNFTTNVDKALGFVSGLTAEDSKGNIDLSTNMLNTLQKKLTELTDANATTTTPGLAPPTVPLSPAPDNNNSNN